MRGLPAVPSSASHRTRRWDALIVGGALPGLVTGVVLAMRGARILVIEEEAAAQGFAGLREPFFTTGAQKGSVLGACLRALGVPLIERNRIFDNIDQSSNLRDLSPVSKTKKLEPGEEEASEEEGKR